MIKKSKYKTVKIEPVEIPMSRIFNLGKLPAPSEIKCKKKRK